MRHHSNELMKAWLRDRPTYRSFAELRKPSQSTEMKRGFLAVGVDENVGIDSDQPP